MTTDRLLSVRHLLAAAVIGLALLAVGCKAADVPVGTLLGSDETPDLSRPTGKPEFDRLDPVLRSAFQEARAAAERDGVRLVITSGWRSRAHQERLYEDALVKYGSPEEANRWVATPDQSAHVTGDAIDIGPTDGAIWVGQHGAEFGLCQTFANEMWHFELLTTPGGTCPEMLTDGSVRR
ncbi:D-alanyl-D-alanine carboxypeptidase [Nocardioides exalbidus]|uniref:D-alanyl-D-alanine carboxypeptidase n=1 Tax=Nocardioides exalbidus TaxID=402596 RepID=A0A1H4R196_9ACTN|nr:M15 family metallopeptidase [Nocardioides exalbidus]SEC25514.1 D-alanyl-D-alanine carboxypeptidase [Nocardioides exalbidus]